MKVRILSAFMILFFASLQVSLAEEGKKKVQIERLIQPVVYDPSSESDIQADDKYTFDLSAVRDKTSVTGSFGFRKDDLFFDITTSGPIDEKAEEVELANLDGLATGFNISGGLSYLYWNPDIDKPAQRQICKEYAKARFGDWVPKDFCQVIKDTIFEPADGVTKEEAESYLVQAQFAKEPKDLKEICERYVQARGGNPPDGFCKHPKPEMFISGGVINEKQANEFLHRSYLAIDKGNAWFFNFRVKGNRNKFKFATPEDLTETEEFKNGRALILGIGVLTRNDHFISLNYRRETSFKGAPISDVCSPISNTDNLICKELALAPPSEKEADILGLEYRYFFGGNFAINPKLFRKFNDDITGIEIPLYFLKDPKANLIGGIKIGWRSDTDDFSVGGFIGTALNLAN